MPGWYSLLSIRLLVWAQVMILELWDRTLCQALCSAWSSLGFLSPSPTAVRPHPLATLSNKNKTKQDRSKPFCLKGPTWSVPLPSNHLYSFCYTLSSYTGNLAVPATVIHAAFSGHMCLLLFLLRMFFPQNFHGLIPPFIGMFSKMRLDETFLDHYY